MRISLQRNRKRGMATIAVMMLLGIILIYVAANLRALELLHRDLKVVDREQTTRWATTLVVTNALPGQTQ